MLRKIVAAIVLVPLAVIILAFAVANRQSVTISFDPLPATSVTLPVFALVILLLIAGVLIGGMASWLRQGKWRQAARRFERELHHLRGKVAAMEGGEGQPTVSPQQGNPPERLRLKPPVR